MRKTVHITRILIQSFTRKPVWLFLVLVGVLLVVGCYIMVYPTEPALAVHMTAYGQLLLTLTFMMMGIQLKSEPRRIYFEDVIAAYSKKSGFFLRCQLLTLCILSLLITFTIMVILYFVTMIGAPALWTKQIFAYIALLYFFPCCVLGAWGLLVAQWNKRRSVFFPAILVWLITSSLATDFNAYFDTLGFESGRLLQTMFSMGVVGMRYIQGAVMTPPIDLPRWIIRIAILLLLVALLLSDNSRRLALLPNKKRKYWAYLLTFTLCGIMVVSYLGYSNNVFYTRFADPEVRLTFALEKSDQYVSGKPVSLKDFPTEKRIALNKTDITLSCSTQGINAQVQMAAVINEATDGQAFTLYSDLVVDEILVDGERASYERANDGVMVYFPVEKKVGGEVNFTFRYHGYSLPIFPANESTVQLNRAFPWLPWPGIKTAMKYSNFYDFAESEDFFIEEWQRGDSVFYTMRYNGPGDLYTNLEPQREGLYSGFSDNGVALYSGMVHNLYRGVDVYTPASHYMNSNVAADAILDAYTVLKDLCERMGASIIPEPPKSIVVVEMKSQRILPYPFVYPHELYSWKSAWEIRQTSTSATLITRARYSEDIEGYQASMDVRAKMAVSYLMTPCTGFPVDSPHSSTKNFAAWLSTYISAPSFDDIQRSQYSDILKEECSGSGQDIILGVRVPEIPITEKEKEWIDVILQRMTAGENFDKSFEQLYQRLLQEDMITPSEIIATLYTNQGG